MREGEGRTCARAERDPEGMEIADFGGTAREVPEGDAADGGGKDELEIRLRTLEKEMLCPICLGVLRKTVMVKECMHRFCKECIHTALRMNNNECPACRTHLPSKRSLRVDERFDAIVQVLYEDLDQYEEADRAHVMDANRKHQEDLQRATQALREKLMAHGKEGEDPEIARGTEQVGPSCSRRSSAAPSAMGIVLVGWTDGSAIPLKSKDLFGVESEVLHRPKYRYKKPAGRQRWKQSVSKRIPCGGDLLSKDLRSGGESSGSKQKEEDALAKKFLLPSLNDPPPNITEEKLDTDELLEDQERFARMDQRWPIDCIISPVDGCSLPTLRNKYLACVPRMTIRVFRSVVAKLFALQQDNIDEDDIIIMRRAKDKHKSICFSMLDLNDTIHRVYYKYGEDGTGLELFYVETPGAENLELSN